jgi:hypothetical protein
MCQFCLFCCGEPIYRVRDLSTNPQNTHASDLFVQGLEDKTVLFVPWIGILLGLYVLSLLIREMAGKLPPKGINHRSALPAGKIVASVSLKKEALALVSG